MERNLIPISKRLSWLLRHGAVEAAVVQDPEGWVAIADALRVARTDRATLDLVVSENEKKRFEIRGEHIRAVQGHSLGRTAVDPAALEASWEVYDGDGPIWHGTSASALPSIAREGLKPQRRTHVHLCDTPDSVVGKRAQVDVMLAVDPSLVRAAGLPIWRSPNGVLLARAIPRAALVDLRVMTRRAREREPALRALLGLEPEEGARA